MSSAVCVHSNGRAELITSSLELDMVSQEGVSLVIQDVAN